MRISVEFAKEAQQRGPPGGTVTSEFPTEFFFFFIALGLELSDAKVYEP